MNTIIKPTVGRVVWFHPSTVIGSTDFSPPAAGQPLAAIVAAVLATGELNLTVFDAVGNPHSQTLVPLVQEGEDVPANGYYAEWMPYQKGQAAKTEALESAMTEVATTTDVSVRQCPAPGADLPPHQQRVIAERSELDERREKLKAFICSPLFSSLGAVEQARLRYQSEVMESYSNILAARICAFMPSTETSCLHGDELRSRPAQ